MTTRNFFEINFNGWTNNPLDYIDKPLRTINGDTILIKKWGDFIVYCNDEEVLRTDSNINVCYYLNMRQTGMVV